VPVRSGTDRARSEELDRPVGAVSSERYLVPAGRHRAETSIRRSRFITTLAHAPDEDAAQARIEAVRDEFPDATHHCWAYVAGPPADTARIGSSDDGEPHGTAGRPILNALLHSNVGEVVAVVTRYFGGVKLGRGGLGRAYGGAVKEALASLPVRERIRRLEVDIELDYAAVDGALRLLEELEAARLAEDFGVRVRIRAGVPAEALERLERGVAELTGGRGRVSRAGND
jgi:uncharacterized YigZ family protein